MKKRPLIENHGELRVCLIQMTCRKRKKPSIWCMAEDWLYERLYWEGQSLAQHYFRYLAVDMI